MSNRGRPSGTGNDRTETLPIRLSTEEKTSIAAEAKRKGKTPSEWSREILLRAAGVLG
mgnify:FL=1